MKINLGLIARCLVSILFIVSATNKLLSPYQNFLFVVETYDMLPDIMELIVARCLPWVELITGIFLLLGLWLSLVLRVSAGMFLMFIVVLTQAIFRKLPITECGCFGESLSVPMPVMLTFDVISLVIIFLCIKNITYVRRFSLDKYFDG